MDAIYSRRLRLHVVIGFASALLTSSGLFGQTPTMTRPHLAIQAGKYNDPIVLSHEGHFIAVARGAEVVLCELKTGIELRSFLSDGDVRNISISPDERLLATAAFDSEEIKVWDTTNGAVVRTLPAKVAHAGNALAFSPDGSRLASAQRDNTVAIWDVNTGTQEFIKQAHIGVFALLTFSSDGKWLAVGSDRFVSVWDLTKSQEIYSSVGTTVKPATGFIIAVAFSPDRRRLMVVTTMNDLAVWDTRTWKQLKVLPPAPPFRFGIGHSRVAFFNPDTRSWVSSDDQRIISRDVQSGNILWSVPSGADYVTSLTHSSNGESFASIKSNTNAPGVIEVRNANGGRVISTISGKGNPLISLAVSKDGKWLATGDNDGHLKLWNLVTGNHMQLLSRGFEPTVAFSPDSRYLASGDRSTISIWETTTGAMSHTFSGHPGYITSLTFSHDGRWLAAGFGGSEVMLSSLWDLHSWTEVSTMPQSAGVTAVAFNFDDSLLASASSHDIKLWAVPSGSSAGTVEGCLAVAFSPDKQLLASGNARCPEFSAIFGSEWIAAYVRDNTLVISDAAGEARRVSTRMYSVASLSFSADGKLLAMTGSGAPFIEVIDARTGREIAVLSDHSDWVSGADFQSQNHLISASWDGSIRVWNLSADKEMELAEIVPLGENDWIAVDAAGQFDTNNLDEMKGLHWVFPNDPLRPLPPETFMRDYYEPQLLARLLAGEEMKAVRPLAGLNRVQPVVEVEKADWQDSAEGIARVTVKVSRSKDTFPRDGKIVEVRTDVYDLRVFRDGQLVGWAPKSSVEWQLEPPPTGPNADELDLQRWREKTQVALDADGTRHLTFSVQVPRQADLKQVTFTAYAFNEDRVKSATASGTLTVAHGLKPRTGKAYILSVGVNRTDSSPNWDLQYAANDARKLSEIVSQKLGATHQFSAVVPLVLVSDQPGQGKAGEAGATKVHLQALLDVLAGRRAVDEQLKREIPNVEKVEKAEPEDLVLLAFSSHGYTDERGVFHMVLADIGKNQPQDRITEELQKRTLSSDELSGWLREVDAGELVMIVDTCHSEATVAYDGFKPGPMGSRGLGQLGYDKGMRILAASKSGQSAIELGGEIKEGLLSYALVHEGLEEGKADFQPKDGKILMSEWLAYGAQEVPNLFSSGQAKGPKGEKPTVKNTRDIIYLGPDQAPPSYQQPVLFDFAKSTIDVVLSQ